MKFSANTYYPVGAISNKIAKEANIPAGTITINSRQLSHIESKHKLQLKPLGLSAFDYVKYICQNFDTITKNNDGSYMLVKTNYDKASATFCMIEMTINMRHGKWLITTAEPKDNPIRNKNTIIWIKKK